MDAISTAASRRRSEAEPCCELTDIEKLGNRRNTFSSAVRILACTRMRFVTTVDDGALRALLTDSLLLWRVVGVVEAGEAPAAAVIRCETGTLVWIERSSTRGVPFRWLVRWRRAGEAAGSAREERPKACASVVGVLGAVRGALGVERGSAIRIAPASVP